MYWQIGSSATIGTGSTFVGKILALTSITLNGGTFRGKSLASNGAITMSARETVSYFASFFVSLSCLCE